MAVNISTFMSLPVPIVGQEPGPTYAFDVNNCFTIVDQHNHVAGSGQQIPPAGLNINSDLSFLNNNAIMLRSARFQPQGAPLALVSDLGCIYESGVDLYYNDGNGVQIRLTQGGSIAGAAGSITGLVSPASATYVSGTQTFVWQSDANTPANMDFASAIFRNLVANSFGLTLQPPAAMGSNFTITLPTLPAGQRFLTLDNSGNMAAVWNVDNVTIEVASNLVRVKPGSIGPTQITAGSITTTQISPTAGILGSQLSASANILGTQLDPAADILTTQIQTTNIVFSTSSGATQSNNTGAAQNVTGLTLNITTTGRPLVVGLMSDPTNGVMSAAWDDGGSAGPAVFVAELIINSAVASFVFPIVQGATPVGAYTAIDQTVAPGNYTIFAQIAGGSGHNANIAFAVLYAYELI